ncbi:cytosolic sulfotransferase 5-like [Punica granatum]|uniref:Sulfotransferase n=1 Tax=Punica granatum TaxID=22663 RepID=A0A6P8D0X9_PUNGR|nr:cytosolic sulfotransferase 5-like [Punica granatum]
MKSLSGTSALSVIKPTQSVTLWLALLPKVSIHRHVPPSGLGNLKDTFVSLRHYDNKLTHNEMGIQALEEVIEEAFDQFCRGVSSYGPYRDHVLDYYETSSVMPPEVLFLRYEEMMEKPGEQMKRMDDLLGFPFSEDEEANGGVDEILRLCSFDNLSNLEVNQTGKLWTGMENEFFFRKGDVGGWVNSLTPEMIERLDHTPEEKLGSSGLKL